MIFWEKKLSREKIYKITGMPLHPMYSINKILWIKNERRDVYKKAFKFLLVEDFIIYKLTGEFGIDYTLASRTMAFNINTTKWSHEILNIAEVDEELLSDPYPSGTIVGQINKDLKNEFGFKNAVSVVTGGHDQPCGALGAGIFQSDMAMNATGTVDALCPVFGYLKYSENMLHFNLAVYPYVIDKFYCSVAFNLTGGLLLRWYRDILCKDEKTRAVENRGDPYELILREMSDNPKDIFILPHFVGSGTPYLDPFSKGAIVGLKISTTKGDLTRAIIDCINYEMKFNIECFNENNFTLKEIRTIGGGSKSTKWLELKASCFGIPVKKLKVDEAVCLGAAILAGYATGAFNSIKEGTQNMVNIQGTFFPKEDLHALYEEKYQKYKKLYGILKDYNRELL
jgi:xylulokinase